MKRKYFRSLLAVIFLTVLFSGYAEESQKKQPRPITIKDALGWKTIRNPLVSNEGNWFAYRLSPNEGNSEIVVRETMGDAEYRFPAGEGSYGKISFSHDSKWFGFMIHPDRKKKKKSKNKKTYDKFALVELPSGKKVEFEKVRSFSFSNENPRWIAFHKYPKDQKRGKSDSPASSDLILRDLATGETFNIGNVSEYSFDKKGRWLAWTVNVEDKGGNGVYLRNMDTGVIYSMDSDSAIYKSLNWTEKGDGLALLKGKESKDYEEKLYSVVGITNFKSRSPKKIIYDPHKNESFPEKMTISPNQRPRFTEDLSAIIFGIHKIKPKEDVKKDKKKNDQNDGKKSEKKKMDKVSDEDIPDMVIWHWKDKRLQPMQEVQQGRDKNFSYLSLYRIKENKFVRLANDTIREVTIAPKDRWAIGYDDQKYQLSASLDGRRYQDIYIIDMKSGKRRVALKKQRWSFNVSPDGTHLLYYKDGNFYTYRLSTGESYNITEKVPTSFINTEDDHNVKNPPIRPFGWTKDGKFVLLYDNWDSWLVPVHGGKGVNLTINGKKDGIRYRRRFILDPDEKGIDLSRPLYFSMYGEWNKKGGVARIDKGKPGPRVLLWENATFKRLMKAKEGDIYLYTRETYKEYPDYYFAHSSLKNGKKITDANPQQKQFLWSSGVRLIDYKSKTGKKLQAALFLPANYQEGKSYPTIVYIYEKLSQRLNYYFTPSVRGFNKSIYNSNGYAVLMPDITYKINDPGMSAVWCVLPAIEAAVKTGIVDKERIGIHGHSWGGYQTAFIITQTDIFKAAVAGAPLTNMISMYNSVYWNTGSANQPIFETSQGRFYGGYWDNLEAYTRNSPVYYAKEVKTPLIILHNDKDGAVDWNQGIEYFNTLRRLKKPVVMLQYKGENHSLRRPENQKDYTLRMKEFFDHYLMGKPAPEWLTDGVPFLKLKDHLKEMVKKIEGNDKEEQKKK